MPKRLPEPPKAPEGLDQDDPQTVVGSGDDTITPTQFDDPACYRSGRANFSNSIEKPPKSPATSSRAPICYTKPLHNGADDPLSNLGNHSKTKRSRCYTGERSLPKAGILLVSN